jgi:hypothetical protein
MLRRHFDQKLNAELKKYTLWGMKYIRESWEIQQEAQKRDIQINRAAYLKNLKPNVKKYTFKGF